MCERGIELGNRRIILLDGRGNDRYRRNNAMIVVSVRMPEYMVDVCKQYARKNKMTFSEFVRYCVMKYLGVADVSR